MTWLTVMECLCYTWPRIWSTRKHFPVLSSFMITGVVTRLTRRVPPVEQELLTLPEHLSPPPVFSGVRVTRSLVLYVCFVDLVFPFVLFLLAIVLSVLLRYTDSDCPFGIFKLFLNIGSQGLKLLRPSELHFYKSKYRSTHLNDAAQQILQHFYYRFFWVFF